jgi:chorismate mutase/prephenate dehydratase
MDIGAIRRDIDKLDAAILDLLNRRARQAIEIGRLKAAASGEVYDPSREREILDRLASLNQGPLTADAVRDIFGAIFAANRLLEKRLTVAYYGPAGTFTHLAARRKFGSGADLRAEDSIAEVFLAVEKKQADFGVVPIENTTAGVVPLTLDAFVESSLQISAEMYVDIEHYLLSRCSSIEEVTKIYSHPHALAQCRAWLRAHMPHTELVPVGSTSRAAELAAAEAGAAAVGPALAGELYELPILRSRIQDQADNRTRFSVIGRVESPPSGQDKTSLVFSTQHRAGALHQALGVFASHQINMTFIQSHPTKQTPWEYMFFVDIQGHVADTHLAQALVELRDHTRSLRVLGSYPKAE